jgi:hypothetical protein
MGCTCLGDSPKVFLGMLDLLPKNLFDRLRVEVSSRSVKEAHFSTEPIGRGANEAGNVLA